MSWQRFLRRGTWDDERARELKAHLEHEIDDNLARGMAPDEARAAASRTLGSVTLVREEIYRMNTLQRGETVWQDLRYALRLLRRSPAFTAVALLSLMLGIGANTAIFELLDAVALRSLPVSRPEEFVEVRISNATHGRTGNFSSRHSMLTGPIWTSLQNHPDIFSSLFAWSATGFDLSDSGESRSVQGLWVSGSFFDALGVRPVLGRLVGLADDTRGCGSPPVVISEGFWQREFGGDRSVVGRVLHLDGVPFEIAGVSPAAFRGVEIGHAFDVAAPLCAEPIVRGADSTLDRPDGWWLGVIGRLAPGVSPERATAALAGLSPAIFQSTVSPHYSNTDAANYRHFALGAFPATTGVSDVRSQYEQPLWFLLALGVLVLLIACGNLANLLMARATAREREMAIRLAIGASRLRLCRQLMVESLLLAVAGAAAGAWVAGAVSRALVTLLSTPDSTLSFDLDMDWRVFAFAVGIGVLTCLAFGLLPAVRATRTAPAAVLRSGGRGLTDSRQRFGTRRVLVVGQIALSLVLCVSALLFIRTFWNLATVNPGFQLDGLLVTDVDYSRANI
ncbi:MAG TPA: ABC transporter permease, partial [Vicinamibacterales bacterium]